jgi:hypothetical protein
LKTIIFGIIALSLFGAIVPAFADSGNCWFIFCFFEKFIEPKEEKLDTTLEEFYTQEAKKGKQLGIKKVNKKISDFKESYNKISEIEKQTDTDLSYLKSTIQQETDFYQSLIDGEKDLQNNPAKYYSQSDLVKLASEFYKNKPDGTPCDDDRRWVEDRNNCVRQATAEKAYFYHDLEWLRYR